MKKYIINEIYTDGYERFVVAIELEYSKKLIIHFFEYDEYLENCEKSKKRNIGDILEGKVFIDLVTESKKVNSELKYYQRYKSSNIEAVVEISKVIDEYSIYAISTILDEEILIEFETSVNYKVGDRIFIEGSLEMSEIKNR